MTLRKLLHDNFSFTLHICQALLHNLQLKDAVHAHRDATMIDLDGTIAMYIIQ